MKPSAFAYYAPESVDEVSRLLAELGDEAKVLAGGQSLVPLLNMRLTRFEALIDVRRVEPLRRVERANGELVVGAMVRQCDVEESAEIRDAVPLLALATPYIGHFQIRSRGTVGGSIAHADPAAEYPAVALALDAQLEVTGPAGSRSIAATDFFTGTWTTALEPDEVLVATRRREHAGARDGGGSGADRHARRRRRPRRDRAANDGRPRPARRPARVGCAAPPGRRWGGAPRARSSTGGGPRWMTLRSRCA